MKLTIELDDDELKGVITQMVAQQFYAEMRTAERKMLSDAVKKAVLDVVYKDKPALLEACVERSYKEIVRKAMPVLYGKFDSAVEDYTKRKEQ